MAMKASQRLMVDAATARNRAWIDEGLALARALLTPGGVISLFNQTSPGSDDIVRSDYR